MKDRLAIIRAALKRLPREKGQRLRSMSWLADKLGCSRQALYKAIGGDCADGSGPSRDLRAELLRMFPELPPWTGVPIPLEDWKR